ncbi:MAG: cytochrome b [Kordiimonadaceae bacterium]|nr:cytochrome b [Kordiimonadaceae bacterium]MBO6568390.1 cytochrome b [Kordiimonadaceae bacterium]MBO6963881.1 cytochrome b [Kordiimonadaceae bacterium]
MSVPKSYSSVAVLLHWVIALMIVGLLFVGFFMARLGDEQLSLKFELYQWHKSFGISVLLLTSLRLVWRLTHQKVEPLAAGWRDAAAHATHVLLYLLSFTIPLAGWAMVSASPWSIPTVLFDLIPWPHIPWLAEAANKAQAEAIFKQIHATMAYGAATLVALHVLAALQHQFWFKHAIFKRMWFSSKDTISEG